MMVPVGSSDQPVTAEREAVALEVTSGSARAVVRPGHPVVMGRDAACDLVVPGNLVSRRHAEVDWTEDGWVLRDLDSRNGTFVEGQRAAYVAVVDGGEVRLGSATDGPVVRFAVIREEPEPASEPQPQLSPEPEPEPEPQPSVEPEPEAAGEPEAEAAGEPATEAQPEPETTGPQPEPAAVAAAESVAPALAVRTPDAEHATAGTVRLGRGETNDIVLGDLRASRHHAELRPTADGSFEVVDLGSRNGTFHNGRQITRAPLAPGDLVAIGRHQFVFDGGRLHEFVDTGPVSLVADDLTVRVKSQVLLDDVSFGLAEGTLLAVIGPSGCGKSTLVKAVTGLRPATQGKVSYDGRDLYEDYAELRYRIGMVPQDDVLHRQLSVRRALRFAAALRFADDVPRKERAGRVAEVLDTLNLTERTKQRIDTLSGGQRKRVSVALELLTEPSLLFLDEPTSGLDPALDKEVMQELRELADTGRTVVIVTHNVLQLHMCDRVLVMCQGGRMGFFGRPDEVLDFFDAEDYAEVFRDVTEDADRWAAAYRQSDHYAKYVNTGVEPPVRRPKHLPPPPRSAEAALAAATAPPGRAVGRAKVKLGGVPLRSRALHPSAPLRQFVTLCLRMLWVIGADRGLSLFLLGLPLALALLSHTVPGDNGLAPSALGFNLEAMRLLVVLVVGAAFLGTAAPIREIVNESTIYKRERAVGLSTGAYLASKVVVYAIVICVQVALFTWLALLGKKRPVDPLVFANAPLLEITVPVTLVALASMAFGLLVSTLVRTTEQTTPILVVAVMAQLVLSGGLFELDGQAVLEQVSWLFPTRWGMAAGASTVDLQPMVHLTDHLWAHTAGAWWRSVLFLVLQFALLVGATRLALRRLEPGRQ
jgi:ABC-type multidrug transport system ATPase subunit/pSer/pThr/pTyr-binding forkhead associated (FHA) protein